ncbi:hypothetical protein T439DRAFT_359594 [Meredithblackwellia eburnea MCA 4105]
MPPRLDNQAILKAVEDAKLVAINKYAWAGSAFLRINQWIYDCGQHQQSKDEIESIISEAKAKTRDSENQKHAPTVASVEREMKGLHALWDLYQDDTYNKPNPPTREEPMGVPGHWTLAGYPQRKSRAERPAASHPAPGPLPADSDLARVASRLPPSHHDNEVSHAYPDSWNSSFTRPSPAGPLSAAPLAGLCLPRTQDDYLAALALRELATQNGYQQSSHAQGPSSNSWNRWTPSGPQAPSSQGEEDVRPGEGPNSNSRSIGHMHSTLSALRRNKYFPIARALASQRF